MECPGCSNLLKKKELINKPHSIYANECMKCGGWWFDNNQLEEYRASLLPTSQYTILPRFELITTINPVLCGRCEQNTLMFYNVGSHVIQKCSECSGIFLSGAQMFELVKEEDFNIVEASFWFAPWEIFLVFTFAIGTILSLIRSIVGALVNRIKVRAKT